MKIFVSAHMDDRTTLFRSTQQQLVAHGHSITQDWSRGDVIPDGFADSASDAGRVSKEDIDGIMAADAFLMLTTHAEEAGRGMYVELGAALMRAELGLLRHVCVVGELTHETVFYFHPLVRRFGTLEECLQFLAAEPVAADAAG